MNDMALSSVTYTLVSTGLYFITVVSQYFLTCEVVTCLKRGYTSNLSHKGRGAFSDFT